MKMFNIPARVSNHFAAFVTALTLLTTLASHSPAEDQKRGTVKCANLIYGKGKTSVCYSPAFLAQIQKETNIVTHPQFVPVKLESEELYQHPFAVMTGEGSFNLTQPQRTALQNYLMNGGFVVASAGCSSKAWSSSFLSELEKMFPETKLQTLDASHPIFHTVYDIHELDRRKSSDQTVLQGLEIDGKIALIFSKDGLNDTGNAGGNCCCCGGNEVQGAMRINVNLLAYTLTH